MRIHHIASAVPGHIHTSDEIAAWTGADKTFIETKVGVVERRFLGANETGGALAAKAVERVLAKAAISAAEIECLIYVTQTPDHGLPHNSALLQHAVGLPKSVAAFDMGLGCSGYTYALTCIKGFMSAQGLKTGLIVTCDPYSKIMRRDDKNTVAVFGDAASATLISPAGSGEIGIGDFGTDGSGASNLIVPAGRAARPIWSIHDQGCAISGNPDDYRLHMNGRGVFNFVMQEVPGSIDRALQKNGLSKDDITWFALHQGSLYMLQQLAQNNGIPQQKLLMNLSSYGNTVSSTIPLLLEDVLDRPGGLKGPVLLSGFGVGLSWGSLVVTFS